MSRPIACLALLGTLACGSSLDASLDGKECSGAGAGVRGYVCSGEQLCVRASETDDAGTPDVLHGGRD